MLALVHASSYLTGLKEQLLEGVPRNASDALDLAGKLRQALKANAIGIPPHELNIHPAEAHALVASGDSCNSRRLTCCNSCNTRRRTRSWQAVTAHFTSFTARGVV